MMLRITVVSFLAVAAYAANTFADEQSTNTDTLIEKNDGLYASDGSSVRPKKLSDPAHYDSATRGDSRVYVVLDAFAVRINLFQCAADGSVKKAIKLKDEQLKDVTAIAGLDFLPDGRVFIEGHVSPTTSVGIVIDLKTGKQHFLSGNRFTWNSAGNHIAYFATSADSTATMELWLDGKKVRDVPASDDAELAWDDRGAQLTVSFPQREKTNGNLVVVQVDGAFVE